MPYDQAHDPKRIQPSTRLTTVLFGTTSIVLGFLAWNLAGGTIGGATATNKGLEAALALALVASHALIAMLLIQGLDNLPRLRSSPWAYRLGFFLSFGLGIARWLGYLLSLSRQSSFVDVAAAFLGAWLGSMLATAIKVGLWENNFPPSPEIEAEVLKIHRDRLGHALSRSHGKRIFDFILALLGLTVSSPLWMLIMLLLWLADPGPLIFIKNSVGKGGVNFRQWKFRTMVQNAEEATGPIVSSRADERVLPIGRFLRRTALDELPQLVNILLGDMSFVGPRPQRTVVVHEYLKIMPEYSDRHLAAPGLSGLAQVAGKPYRTPRQKLRYDRIYAQHANLGFDLKLLSLAFLIVFWMRWMPGWRGNVPRSWLRCGKTGSKHVGGRGLLPGSALE